MISLKPYQLYQHRFQTSSAERWTLCLPSAKASLILNEACESCKQTINKVVIMLKSHAPATLLQLLGQHGQNSTSAAWIADAQILSDQAGDKLELHSSCSSIRASTACPDNLPTCKQREACAHQATNCSTSQQGRLEAQKHTLSCKTLKRSSAVLQCRSGMNCLQIALQHTSESVATHLLSIQIAGFTGCSCRYSKAGYAWLQEYHQERCSSQCSLNR